MLHFTLVQILSIILTLGLALDIRNEKKLAKKWRLEHPKPKARKTMKMTKIPNY